jgi:hypothetical protein
VGSAPLGKFSTLLYFSKGCQTSSLRRFDPIRPVLNMELLQFYYSGHHTNWRHADPCLFASNNPNERIPLFSTFHTALTPVVSHQPSKTRPEDHFHSIPVFLGSLPFLPFPNSLFFLAERPSIW